VNENTHYSSTETTLNVVAGSMVYVVDWFGNVF